MSRGKKGKTAPSKSEARIQFDPKVIEALVPGLITPTQANELIHDSKEGAARTRAGRRADTSSRVREG